MFTQQETVTHCLLFILQPIYKFAWPISAHVLTANRITPLQMATLSTDQSNRFPGFLNFQLTLTLKTTTWLWRWLLHRLLKSQSLTTVLLRTPITRVIFFNQGLLLLGSNHFLIPKSTNKHLSEISVDEYSFNKATALYPKALDNSGNNHWLTFTPTKHSLWTVPEGSATETSLTFLVQPTF